MGDRLSDIKRQASEDRQRVQLEEAQAEIEKFRGLVDRLELDQRERGADIMRLQAEVERLKAERDGPIHFDRVLNDVEMAVLAEGYPASFAAGMERAAKMIEGPHTDHLAAAIRAEIKRA